LLHINKKRLILLSVLQFLKLVYVDMVSCSTFSSVETLFLFFKNFENFNYHKIQIFTMEVIIFLSSNLVALVSKETSFILSFSSYSFSILILYLNPSICHVHEGEIFKFGDSHHTS